MKGIRMTRNLFSLIGLVFLKKYNLVTIGLDETVQVCIDPGRG